MRPAVIAVIAASLTIVLKGGGYIVTGSVAILSDAFESLVNLVTSIIALIVLSIAARPADEEHAYGHTKAEYFASGFEGSLIFFAAMSIAIAAAQRLVSPVELQAIVPGLGLATAATVVNLVAARMLFQASRIHRSITLEAGAHHLMTDVWTSVAVIGGVWIASRTGFLWLDPIIAAVVAANILRTGYTLIRRSLLGLLDTSLPEPIRRDINQVLDEQRLAGVQYHALRTRQAGRWRFISVHILVPGDWSVQRGHDLLEEIEKRIRRIVPDSTVFTHLEPIEDPLSWQDTELKRD
jgi:cation diffusion facilitator family transporter